jgi:GcrA cell cycle regulator
MMTIDWTPERTNALIALWDEGHSTAEIGRRLGVTKNAVVGKVHRLRLPKRGSPIHGGSGHGGRSEAPVSIHRAPAAPRPQASIAPRPVLASAPIVAKPQPLIPTAVYEPMPANVIKLSALTSDMCSWPIGDPGTAGFRFCGRSAVTGKPYCAEHCSIAYVKVSKDRNKETEAA